MVFIAGKLCDHAFSDLNLPCKALYKCSFTFKFLQVNGQHDIPEMPSSVGSRASSVAGPQAWNQPHTSSHHMDCVATFKCNLKSKLFMEAHCVSE